MRTALFGFIIPYMKFLIRDDDTCAFTRPEELTRCYEGIWHKVPVNLSVTPFRIPGCFKTVPKSFFGQTAPIPLEENQELIAFLKEKQSSGRIHIALHGYNHAKPRGLPEYVGGTNLFEKTKAGKQYIEDVLDCEVTTFVPPNNGIAREGFQAIVGNGLHLINIPPLLRPGFRTVGPRNFIYYLRVKYYSILKKMRYPYVLHFNDHKEAEYYAVTPSQKLSALVDGFKKCVKTDGVFIFSCHYHAFDRRLVSGERIGDVLTIFLELVEKVPDIECLTYDQLWNTE